MYFYRIGFSDWEGSGEVQLMHPQKFGPRQFEALVREATAEAAQRHLDEECARARKSATRSPVARADFESRETRWQIPGERPWRDQIRFDDLYREVADILVERHGFALVPYQQSVHLFAGMDLMNPTDNRHASPQSKRFTKTLLEKVRVPELDLPPLTAEEQEMIAQQERGERDLFLESLVTERDEESKSERVIPGDMAGGGG